MIFAILLFYHMGLLSVKQSLRLHLLEGFILNYMFDVFDQIMLVCNNIFFKVALF